MGEGGSHVQESQEEGKLGGRPAWVVHTLELGRKGELLKMR